ncbi:MAG: relaxase/mobilization nuclease domain-containing protein [Roseburia sp.]|nr:relaxase/mobilization nuclease domain-containing protein [Roseburia sp.]
MAVTKIKAIKSTLDKAINYICNPAKTENGLLIDSFGCVPEFAALQMEATAKKNKKGGCRKAYHLMQSFSPEDDITPEQALEIGKSFANKVTKGKYEYVIAVHNDRDHIHCHIIFNAVDTEEYKKYHYQGYCERDRIRDISDKLCRDNGLSVLPRWTKGKGRGQYEYGQHKAGNSWKDKLRTVIDQAIPVSQTFDDFVAAMEMEGYTFKDGKHIAFIAEDAGQKRPTRCKTLGDFYTEDMIRDRIANKEKYKDMDLSLNTGKSSQAKEAAEPSGGKEPNTQNAYNEKKANEASGDSVRNENMKKRSFFADGRINLITDLSKNVKAQNSEGYRHVVEKSNLNMLVRTMNFLTEHDIETPERFNEFYDSRHKEVVDLNRKIQKLDLAITDLKEKRNHIRKYFANRKFYNTFMKYKNMNYYKEHENEIRDFELSKIWLEHNGMDPRDYDYREYQKEYDALKSEKDALGEKLKTAKSLLYDTDTVMKNVETALGIRLYENEKTEETQNRNPEENTGQQNREKSR